MKRTTKEFQSTLKRRRFAFGYTQRELARRVGVEGSHITYLENGGRVPSLPLVMRLAKVLGVRPGKLALQAIPQLAEFGVK